MALIKCPECGNDVSDKAIKCPRCGYPLKQEEIKTVPEQKEDNFNSSEDSAFEVGEKKKKGTKKIGIYVGGALLLLVASVGSFVGKIANQPFAVNEMSLSKWKLTDSDTYSDYYKGFIESDQTKPFIAVIGNYKDKESKPDFYVYMEDGKGEFEAIENDDDDPSIKYLPVGYIPGNVVSDSDIEKITYDDNQYDDNYNDTSCMIYIDIEMKKKENGLLFVQIENDLNKKIKKNVEINIVDGKGEYSYYLRDLPLKSRGVTVKLIPQLFCKAESIKDGDYTVEEPFEVKKEGENLNKYVSYDGKEEMSFGNLENGLLLYTEKLVDGGREDERDKVYNRASVISKNKCEIETYIFSNKEDKILMPSYEINKIGYVKIEKYNTQRSQ